jgi:hypothetical protein
MKQLRRASKIAIAFLFSLSICAYAPRASSQDQTTNGPCSPIFNGSNNTNNCDTTPPPRVIPPDYYKQVRDYLAQTPTTVIISVMGSAESYSFARALYNLLKDADWNMRDGDVRGTQLTGAPPWEGVTVKYRGTPIPEGQDERITGNDPADHLGQVLGALKFNPSADRNENYPANVIEIEIGDQPKQPSPRQQ